VALVLVELGLVRQALEDDLEAVHRQRFNDSFGLASHE
jgi:hypothetical protein